MVSNWKKAVSSGATVQQSGGLDLTANFASNGQYPISIQFANESLNMNLIVAYGACRKIVPPGSTQEFAIQIPDVFDGSMYKWSFEVINGAAAYRPQLTWSIQTINEKK